MYKQGGIINGNSILGNGIINNHNPLCNRMCCRKGRIMYEIEELTYEDYLLDKVEVLIENNIKLRRKNETFQKNAKAKKKKTYNV